MKKTRLAIVFLLIFLMLILSACSSSSGSERYLLSQNVISTTKDASYATAGTKFKKKQKVASSGLIDLYFEEKTCSVAIKDNSTAAWWYALSPDFVETADYTPCVLSLEVMYKGQKYYLDSQRDSVALSSVTNEKTENGITVTYTFNLSLSKSESAVFTVPVEYSLVDGSLYVSVDCANINDENNPKDAVITNINLLNFFGSSTSAKNGDYILVPDNCGGLIYTKKATDKFENVSLKVYGDTQENNAVLGAYGVKSGDNAFVAIIEDGDAIATVNATAAATTAGYNRVGASFAITELATMQKNEEETYVYVPSLSYDGKISICYRFLSGSNADYSGMAIACREQLIRNGILSAETVDASDDLPFVVSVLGAASTKENGKLQTLTTFEQLQDMLTLLKAKGFNNIYVKYKGALSGGLDQSGISEDMTFYKNMGTQEEFTELKDYASAQKIKLFFDISYLTSPYGTLKSSQLATGSDGKTITKVATNVFGVNENRNLASMSIIEKNAIELHKFVRENGISEISVADSSVLYADYASGATRVDLKEEIAAENLSLSSSAEVMVSKGNFYTLKNAGVVSSLPTTTSREETSAYVGVPFIQMILHGTLDYSCEPINYTEDYKTAVLRAIEYGALGEFEWCYEILSDETSEEAGDEVAKAQSEKQTPDTFAYSTWANEVYAYYAKGNKALGDLRGSRMTDHYKVKTGIYCTEYGDTSIYVNYTDEDYEVQGVTVPANDFMRIN